MKSILFFTIILHVLTQANKHTIDTDVLDTYVEENGGNGDLLLFHGNDPISRCIRVLSQSSISHCALLIRDPIYIHKSLKGLYVMESSRFKNPYKRDIHLVPFHKIIDREKQLGNQVYWRSLYDKKRLCNTDLYDIYNTIKDGKYDLSIEHWFKAFQVRKYKIKTSFFDQKQFDCSALVGYYYNRLGILSRDQDWTTLSPASFFSKDKNRVNIMYPYYLRPERRIITYFKKKNKIQ